MLGKNRVYEGDLILVSPDHALQSAGAPDLVPAMAGFPDILLRRDAAEALRAALAEIAAGTQIVPVSGYRSMDEQIQIYDDSLRENGAEFTAQFVALPGHSEHQTGLAIDLGLNSDHIDFIRPDLPYDGICGRFREAAPGYGFILRYPAGKEAVTGIAHEPWHFRFVGCPHARIMTERGLTLEEYVEYLKGFPQSSPLVCEDAEVFYVPANGELTALSLPAGARVSGNNVDGFIVTVRRDGR